MSIVVIGNGPSATAHERGDVIDSFDEVVRFNRYRTIGYEKLVGTRTTVWVKNDMIDDSESEQPVKSYKRILLYYPRFKLKLGKKPAPTTKRAEQIPYEVEDEVRGLCQMPSDVWPAAGPMAIAFLAKEYQEIFVHGFDLFAGTRHHYFPDQDGRSVHREKYDRRFMEAMVATGVVRELSVLEG